MKTNFIIVAITAVLAGLTSAQNGLPTCAQSCVTKYTSGSQIAGCTNLDVACICSNSSFLSGIACCLTDACDEADKATAVAYAQNLCKTSGVTNLPSVVSCVSTASSTASSAASSAAGAASTITSGSTDATTTSGSGTNTASGAVVSSSKAATASSSSASASATSNAAGLQNEIGVGASLLGGLAAMVGLL